MTLSPAQLRVLKALNHPGAVAYFREVRNKSHHKYGPGWILPALEFAEINTMRVLFERGLISAPEEGRAVIAAAGVEYLMVRRAA